MKQLGLKIFLVTIITVFTLMLIAGCQEKNLSDSKTENKMSKVVAAENIELKKQLADCQKDVEEQKRMLEGKPPMDMEGIMTEVLKDVAEETGKLKAENNDLKAKIKSLEEKQTEVK